MAGINLQADSMVIPARLIPGMRTAHAIENNRLNDILIVNWGGLGDQVCAEPTLRYAIENFAPKGVRISLASHWPELFRHLKFEKVFTLEKDKIPDEFYTFHTSPQPQDLAYQFISHTITNCVDAPALYAFRCQLPIKYKQVQVYSEPIIVPDDLRVVVHPGKHWPSKTFPKKWWDDVLAYLIGMGFEPVIVGKDMGPDDNRGTVDVNTKGCIDLRDRLDVNGLAYLLSKAKVILTNDSSPIHLGAAGRAFIGFVATCKHPDFITHWRNGVWSWRMRNFGRGGMWEILDHLPNKVEETSVDKCTPDQLLSWLPDPVELAEWTVEKSREYDA